MSDNYYDTASTEVLIFSIFVLEKQRLRSGKIYRVVPDLKGEKIVFIKDVPIFKNGRL